MTAGRSRSGRWSSTLNEEDLTPFLLARTYRVTRHLETVNAQKQAALDTYPLFVEAVSSEQGRDIVTAELARAVLQGADSGFITADRERTVVESSPVSLLANRGSALPPG